jgi:hypothetical protein
VGRGKKKVVLSGQNAEDAWDTPIKANANDLSGRLPLAIGMPIFIVDNLAVNLGLSNGSDGTVVNIAYELVDGRRYLVSVDLDVPRYVSSDPDAALPHRLTLVPISKTITWRSRGGKKTYSASRRQIPIIGSFAFTSHNSQSRSLNSAVIHLDSCKSTASAYVMLSRIKCGLEQPMGLRILGKLDPAKISNRAKKDVRDEEKRLKVLDTQTLKRARDILKWYTELGNEL